MTKSARSPRQPRSANSALFLAKELTVTDTKSRGAFGKKKKKRHFFFALKSGAKTKKVLIKLFAIFDFVS